MTLYKVYDPEWPQSASTVNYYRTPEEAQAAIAGRVKYVNPGCVAVLGQEYLLVEEVERESQPCAYCGEEVQSDKPGVDYCRACHYSGTAQASDRAEQIAQFEAALPGATVAIEHTGGGCFWFAVYPKGHLNTFYVLTDGDAVLPEDARGGWGYVGRHSLSEEHADYEGTALWWYYDDKNAQEGIRLSDEEAIALIKADMEERS